MILCDYGCGQEARYQFKNGKWCCSSHANKCFNREYWVEYYNSILKEGK
jgi:hypothetical protein